MNFSVDSNLFPGLIQEEDPFFQRRVFVNRTLLMEQISVIGFDMDYTLIVYNQKQMEELSIKCALHKMVRLGYSAEILQLNYEHNFSIRGLVLDVELGNILKMDRYGYVEIAFHGSKLLLREERFRLYRQQHTKRVPPRYAWVDTLYALPEVIIFATLVDYFDKNGVNEGLAERYSTLWADIRKCTDESHKDGSIKKEILSDPERFIHQDPDLAPMLHRLRSAGKKLFLLTNSHWDYTRQIMSFLLDGKNSSYTNWRHYFDAVVVDAQKPAFFSGSHPLYELTEEGKILRIVGHEALERGKIYQAGNISDFQIQIGGYGDKVLYIGDHIYGDVLRAKKTSVWRTAMIIQELEQEIGVLHKIGNKINEMDRLERRRVRLEAELYYQQLLLQKIHRQSDEKEDSLAQKQLNKQHKRIETLEKVHKKLNLELDELGSDIQKQFNPFFGPIFKAGNENSLFAEQVETYACLYTSRVSNFLAYSPFHLFRSPREHLPHERVS